MSGTNTPSFSRLGLHVAAASALAAASGQAIGQTFGPQIRIDTAAAGKAANETTASASEFNPDRIVAGWNDWRQSFGTTEVINCGAAVSFDGGATWTDFLLRPPPANQSGVEGDPMTAYDDRTGALWVGAISFSGNGGIYVARLDAGSNTFNASVMARVSGGTDKCWMAAGRAHDNANATRVYIAYNEGCIRSTDMGQTWSAPVSLGSGIGFLPRVGPNGELYIAYWDFGNGVRLKRSLNGGVSFTTHNIATRLDTWGTQDGSRFPGNFRVPPMNYIAVDPNDGTLYCVYFDTSAINGGNRDVDLYFTKSTNQGTNWTAPVIIPNTDGSNLNADQFWPWIEVDSTGRIHIVFFDGRHTTQNDSSANTNGFFDTYFAYSEDGGATWTQQRLTPASWNCFNDGLNRSQQFLGDYNGMAQAGDRLYPVYLDTSSGDPNIFTNQISFACPDWNGDGTVDAFDYDDFVSDFFNYVLFGTGFPDYNDDGTVDAFDYDDFVNDFFGGCN